MRAPVQLEQHRAPSLAGDGGAALDADLFADDGALVGVSCSTMRYLHVDPEGIAKAEKAAASRRRWVAA